MEGQCGGCPSARRGVGLRPASYPFRWRAADAFWLWVRQPDGLPAVYFFRRKLSGYSLDIGCRKAPSMDAQLVVRRFPERWGEGCHITFPLLSLRLPLPVLFLCFPFGPY